MQRGGKTVRNKRDLKQMDCVNVWKDVGRAQCLNEIRCTFGNRCNDGPGSVNGVAYPPFLHVTEITIAFRSDQG